MKISLIITTYNREEALRLVLASACQQSRLPDELIVADDGSTPATAMVVQAMAQRASFPMIHSWQEDRGFRVARSRNLAIARATGDYLIFIDGDILLEPHFVEDHGALAERGYFLQGSRVLLSDATTRALLATERIRVTASDVGWANRHKIIRWRPLARLLTTADHGLKGTRSCNFSFWREDAIRINGFNEAFVGWGREDSEFVARLFHSGVQRKKILFHAIGYHLHHPFLSRAAVERNDQILQQTIEGKALFCEQGLMQHSQSAEDP